VLRQVHRSAEVLRAHVGGQGQRDASGHLLAARAGEPPRDCWHLGCILPRVPAISLRTGRAIHRTPAPGVVLCHHAGAVNPTACKRLFSLGRVAHADALCSASRACRRAAPFRRRRRHRSRRLPRHQSRGRACTCMACAATRSSAALASSAMAPAVNSAAATGPKWTRSTKRSSAVAH